METMRDETPAVPPAEYKYVFTHRPPNSSLIVIQDHHEDTDGPVEDLKHFYLMFESESLPSRLVYRKLVNRIKSQNYRLYPERVGGFYDEEIERVVLARQNKDLYSNRIYRVEIYERRTPKPSLRFSKKRRSSKILKECYVLEPIIEE